MFIKSKMSSFSVFVSNLNIADMCMGFYLVIIFAADNAYRGIYVLRDLQWKNSVFCSIAGFLSLLSNEVSAFKILLITIDRFLVFRFPFSRYHFKFRSACVASGVCWVIGFILAAIPFLPFASHWKFYSQTSICIPLPFVTDTNFPGYPYSFSVTIVFNFIIFLLIAAGQISIYLSIQANAMKTSAKDTSNKDAMIAARLITVALSDFFCWFPIGLLGILKFYMDIDERLSVAMAIFVLPFNSALNPFLYTLNVLMEIRNKKLEKAFIDRFKKQLKMEQRENTVSSGSQCMIVCSCCEHACLNE